MQTSVTKIVNTTITYKSQMQKTIDLTNVYRFYLVPFLKLLNNMSNYSNLWNHIMVNSQMDSIKSKKYHLLLMP